MCEKSHRFRYLTEKSGWPQGKISPASESLGPTGPCSVHRGPIPWLHDTGRRHRWPPRPRLAATQRKPICPARPRSCRPQDASTGRMVVRQLRHRRRDAADRRRGTLRGARSQGRLKVLDVAAGNGMATLAAARRWCDVTSTSCSGPEVDRISRRESVRNLTDLEISLKNQDRLKAKSARHQQSLGPDRAMFGSSRPHSVAA